MKLAISLLFLSGSLTGFTFVPVTLQPNVSRTFLYEGTFLISTGSLVTAIQLYQGSDPVTVLKHVFDIPLPEKYMHVGPLASDAEHVFMVAHPSDESQQDLLVYRVKDGALVCTKPIKSLGRETGMVVRKLHGSVYEVTLLQAISLQLKTYAIDLETCSPE